MLGHETDQEHYGALSRRRKKGPGLERGRKVEETLKEKKKKVDSESVLTTAFWA